MNNIGAVIALGVLTSTDFSKPTLPDDTFGRVVGSGVQCVAYGSQIASGPINFPVSSVGEAGTPRLSVDDRQTLMKILRFVRPQELRYAFVEGKFIVYQANRGLCADTAPGYVVLNRGCNVAYEPGEDPEHLSALPECTTFPRPWSK